MNYIDELSNKVEAIMNGKKLLIVRCSVCNHPVNVDTIADADQTYMHRKCVDKL